MARSSRKLWAEHLAGKGRAATAIDPKALLKKVPYSGRILGVDPSLRGMGLAVVEFEPNRPHRLLDSLTLKIKPKIPFVDCLGEIHKAVAAMAEKWNPRHLSCEETIYVNNFKTAQIMGAARGSALSAAAIRGLPVFEYAPLRVKQAVVGFGRASKEQVARTMAQMLQLPEPLSYDESDAAALALCHAFTWMPS